MFTKMDKRLKYGLVLGVILALIVTVVALASDVDVAVVDVTVPTNSVSLAPGASSPITINMSVTGNQVGTATFEVYRDWTLSGGTFTGSNPQEFTVGPRASGDPATTFSTSGTVAIAAGQAAGTFTLAVGAFDITNTNTTGAKLAAGDPSNYQVTVSVPPPPSDTTPPVISYELNPASPDGENGWYVSDVTLTWTVSEPESPGSLVKTGCVDQNITADQAATDYSCSATSDGGSAGPVTVTIKRDATVPTISFAGPSTTTWYNADVTANWDCSDALSGVVSASVSDTTDGEGDDQPATGTCTDNAGNTANDTQHFMVDKTPPEVAVTGVADGATYTLGSVPAAGCSTSDPLSGVATNATLSQTGGPVGSVTASCTGALDNAGNTGSASVTYSVIYDFDGFRPPVDNPPVLNTVKAGSAIPVKFSLNGDQGLNIFATGYPKAYSIACDATGPTDAIETLTAGNSSLSYDVTADQYVYVWKTDKAWANSCRQLVVKLDDGTEHVANFSFKK